MSKKTFLLVFISFLISCNNSENSLSGQEETIQSIKKTILPDSRDAIFDLTLHPEKDKWIIKGATDQKALKEAFLKALDSAHIQYTDSMSVLPVDDFKNKIAVCRLPVANLRAQPKHSAELVTQVLMGMPLQVFEEKNDFYSVKTPEGYYAWVDRAGIEILPNEAFSGWLNKPKLIVTNHCGKTYSKPSKQSEVVSDFVLNDVFAWLYDEDHFACILYPDGRKAFLPKDDCLKLTDFEKQNKQITGDDIVNDARRYLGISYLWGGTSTKGLDCSGFSKNVYAQAGYLLPRDASQQVKIGKPVEITADFKNLQPGDLLFFGRKLKGKDKITHVAIHIKDGLIIHATGEVKIESLNSDSELFNEQRLKSLLQARRIIGYFPQSLVHIYHNPS